MFKVKAPSVAGSFYPDDKNELIKTITFMMSKKEYNYPSRAVIVPHAGYIYSGKLAFAGIECLDKNVKNIFIFAPAHRVFVEGCALSSYDYWNTPLGDVKINQEINKELEENFGCNFFDKAYEEEHAVEIQLPIIQTLFKEISVVPILVGREEVENIKKIMEHFYKNKENAFIISSDLSHFHSAENAEKIDNYTFDMIEENNVENFQSEQACGATSVCALVEFSRENNFSLIRIGAFNSSEVSGYSQRVVGYGSWMLFEGERNEFINKFFKDKVIEICKTSIQKTFEGFVDIKIKDYPKVLDEKGACFVTLEIDGNLRGCVGSIIAHQSLINDLLQNSYNAAFNDTRFYPLTEEEFKHTKINVSLLSAPKKIEFESEEDLLNKIVPFEDGIIIKDGRYQAVYLPSVWDTINNKREFLNSLKQKAGLPPDYYSKTFEAYRFKTEYLK